MCPYYIVRVIISGGSLVNKGAQAMTLISICELKKRFPNHKMLLLTWDASPASKERCGMYDMELLEIPPLKFSQAARSPVKAALFTLRYGSTFRSIDAIYRSTDLMIDVSGYALGSNWSAKICNDYLDNIEHALAYSIPVYLMPQSFGPFGWSGEEEEKNDARIRKLLPRVKLICAREEEGYQALVSRYGLENVILTRDMVLASSICDYSPAFKEQVSFTLPEIAENSMCVIPSIKVKHVLGESAIDIYRTIIDESLKLKLNVYITYHSALDKELCLELKAIFSKEDRVILLEHDHSCIEFNELVKRFNFVAASRFHAIVHALKNGVPCIALGWAVKYVELMKLFHQDAYVFDLREQVVADDVSVAVESMARNWRIEAETIKSALPDLQKENVFDRIKEA